MCPRSSTSRHDIFCVVCAARRTADVDVTITADVSYCRLYAVAIRAAQKAGDWREAVLFYREAELVDPGPSAATATCVFLACYEAKQVLLTDWLTAMNG